MLYLCLSLPQLPLEARQPVTDDPVAIIDRRGSKRWLIACNAPCRQPEVQIGLLVGVVSVGLFARGPADVRAGAAQGMRELKAGTSS